GLVEIERMQIADGAAVFLDGIERQRVGNGLARLARDDLVPRLTPRGVLPKVGLGCLRHRARLSAHPGEINAALVPQAAPTIASPYAPSILRRTRAAKRSTFTTTRSCVPSPIGSFSSWAATRKKRVRPSTFVSSAIAVTRMPTGVAAKCRTSRRMPRL